MRVTLAYPSDGLVYTFNKGRRTKRIPLGIAYVGAALLTEGHDVKVVDAALDDLTPEQAALSILAHDPELVGIGCTTPLYHEANKIIDLIKKQSPATKIVMGGPHVSALPEATMRNSNTDFVCIGEGEESILGIVKVIQGTLQPQNVPGIAYRWDGQEGQTQEYRLRLHQSKRTTVQAIDLNKVPIPARHLFDQERYRDYARDIVEAQSGTMFSRGCPGKCAFCGAADTLVRFRNLENCWEELEQIQAMGIKNVFVMDDTYTSNKKRLLELSKGIVARNINLRISVQLRLDQLDEEVCDAMYASGVRYVGPGIESGNETIMKAIGKGPKENKKHMREKIRLLQKYDWRIRNSYVMGMPGETEEQILETLDFAKELGADENAFSILVPYPDSPLWYLAKQTGKVSDDMDFSKFLYYHAIGCNLSAVSTERLLELHEFAYEYVGNPAYKLDDDAVSSGNRPHIPYLASEAFKKHRESISYDDSDKRREV